MTARVEVKGPANPREQLATIYALERDDNMCIRKLYATRGAAEAAIEERYDSHWHVVAFERKP